MATIITDTPRFSHVRKERVALWACLLGFFCSVAFITDIGSFLFDIFDHFLLNYGAPTKPTLRVCVCVCAA